MQKKTIRRLAAAGVLSVAVAAVLVWAGNRDTGESLTYNELLALAGDEEAAASVEAELEVSSDLEEDSALSRLLEELETEDASSASEEADSAISEENAASEMESEASTSSKTSSVMSKSEAVSSSASSKVASSAVSGASHSTAAPDREYSSSGSSHTASSAAHSTAASSSHAASSHSTVSSSAEKTCDEQLAECIRKIEALQTRSEKELYGIIYEAFDEYMSHPASERNLMLKVSVVLSKSGELNKAQSKCDKEFKEIVTEMRKILKDNGRDQTLADEAERTYKQKKNAMIKELTDQAYSGGDGSGQSGKWLAEKAGKLS